MVVRADLAGRVEALGHGGRMADRGARAAQAGRFHKQSQVPIAGADRVDPEALVAGRAARVDVAACAAAEAVVDLVCCLTRARF